MRIIKEKDPGAVDVEDALNRQQPAFKVSVLFMSDLLGLLLFQPQLGFEPEHTVFVGDERLLLVAGHFLCELDTRACEDERTFLDLNARISALGVLPSMNLLAVCVDYRRGATVFIKQCEDIVPTKKSFIVGSVNVFFVLFTRI